MPVYFIQSVNGGPIKIGVSGDPVKRLAELQTSHHEVLQIIGTTPGGHGQEKQLHKIFERHALLGEWFRPDQEIIDFINSAPTEITIPPHVKKFLVALSSMNGRSIEEEIVYLLTQNADCKNYVMTENGLLKRSTIIVDQIISRAVITKEAGVITIRNCINILTSDSDMSAVIGKILRDNGVRVEGPKSARELWLARAHPAIPLSFEDSEFREGWSQILRSELGDDKTARGKQRFGYSAHHTIGVPLNLAMEGKLGLT